MANTFKCQFCGSEIRDNVCPHCGGVHFLPSDEDSDKKTSSGTENSSPDNSSGNPSKISKPPKSILVFFAIFLSLCIIIVVVGSLQQESIKVKPTPISKPVVVPTSDSLISETVIPSVPEVTSVPEMLTNGHFYALNSDGKYYLVKENGFTESNHILTGSAEEPISVTVMGNNYNFSLPCDYPALNENVPLIAPYEFQTIDDKTQQIFIETLESHKENKAYDSYSVLTFEIFNNSFETKKLEECICDTLKVYTTSKVQSFIYQGTELVTNPADVIEALGDPKEEQSALDFYSLRYETLYGTMELMYIINDDKSITDIPTYIGITNCAGTRIY